MCTSKLCESLMPIGSLWVLLVFLCHRFSGGSVCSKDRQTWVLLWTAAGRLLQWVQQNNTCSTPLNYYVVFFSSALYGNHGCKGGIMDNAFRYLETHKDETEAEYPYKAEVCIVDNLTIRRSIIVIFHFLGWFMPLHSFRRCGRWYWVYKHHAWIWSSSKGSCC